jgi:NADPH:quinone reductase-like Zn-dependent oxidoreductase
MAKFGSIITYASTRHAAYVKSLGATECIDRNEVSFENLPETMKKVTSSPVNVIYDAIASRDSQLAGYDLLASGGTIVVVDPRFDHIKNVVEDKKIIKVFGSVYVPTNLEFGREMYRKLSKLLDEDILVVSERSSLCRLHVADKFPPSPTESRIFQEVWMELWMVCRD